jgi:hypothetical protein
MALLATALVSLADAKQYLNETSDDNDAQIERAINALTNTFEMETSRLLKARAVVDYRVDGNGKFEILLPPPVQSVTKVEIRDPVTDTSLTIVTDTTKFVLKDTRTARFLMKENLLLLGYKNILISGVFGFASTDIELYKCQDLLLTQLKFDYMAWQHNETGVNARTMTDGSVAFVTRNQLLDKVQQGLDQLSARVPLA